MNFLIDDDVFELGPYSNLKGGSMDLELYNINTGYAFHEFSISYGLVLPGGWNFVCRIYRMLLEEFAKEDISPAGVGVRKVRDGKSSE